MLHIYPSFYREFRCAASACPDSCCVGWEVVVDEEAAAYYASLSGPLADALRRAMTVDSDGDRVIGMENGHCPFWTAEHLCRVELELGHNAPCATCRKFPRLTQDYDVFTEYGLTLACPEAARLILTQPGPWPQQTEGVPGSPENVEFDWEFLLELSSARQVLLELLWRQDLGSREALGLCLKLSERFQSAFDGQPLADWNEEDARKAFRTRPQSSFQPLLKLHRGMEILTAQWQTLLDEALKFELRPTDWAALDALPETPELRNLGTYYLYRYWFQTVSDYDCRLKLQKLAAAWAVTRYLQCVRLAKTGTLSLADRLRLHQLYSKEVEHDAENENALELALLENPAFSLQSLWMLI